MTNYKVVEIFSSINGEGIRAGQLAVFVRMQGCNLNCTYCDTKWANEADAKFHWTSTEEILELLRSMEIKNVTITGGEPLLQEEIGELLEAMAKRRTCGLRLKQMEVYHCSRLQRFRTDRLLPWITSCRAVVWEKYMLPENLQCFVRRIQ